MKSTEDHKTVTVALRLTAPTRAALAALAKTHQMSLSAYLASVLVQHVQAAALGLPGAPAGPQAGGEQMVSDDAVTDRLDRIEAVLADVKQHTEAISARFEHLFVEGD